MKTQALAQINNYICTKQWHKAHSTLEIVKTIYPEHEAYQFFDKNQPCELFGKNWQGQSLDGKTLEIWCDHGIGDTVQMFRYIKKLKDSFDVTIILNCLIYDPLKRFMEGLEFIDVFTNNHDGCDFHTNIMQLTRHHHNHSMWRDILACEIPEQPLIWPIVDTDFDSLLPGLKYQSNQVDPILFEKKSISSENFDFEYVSLEPDADWQQEVEVGDIADLVAIMSRLPLVISVDTLTLHLAGSMGLPTIGLLATPSDARWGFEETTPWYPSVKLFRQKRPGCWEEPVNMAKKIVDSMD